MIFAAAVESIRIELLWRRLVLTRNLLPRLQCSVTCYAGRLIQEHFEHETPVILGPEISLSEN